MPRGPIWDDDGRTQLAWVEGFAIVNVDERKIATVDNDGRLYSLDGKPLDIYLQGAHVIAGGGSNTTRGIQEALQVALPPATTARGFSSPRLS